MLSYVFISSSTLPLFLFLFVVGVYLYLCLFLKFSNDHFNLCPVSLYSVIYMSMSMSLCRVLVYASHVYFGLFYILFLFGSLNLYACFHVISMDII
jgi:hypothetical protein